MQQVLTKDQEKAYNEIVTFILNPNESVHVLSGFAGTGKSTLMSHLCNNISSIFKMQKLLEIKSGINEIRLTATTNQAAMALATVTGIHTSTVHSTLGLTVHFDARRGENTLGLRRGAPILRGAVLVVDEANFIDSVLFKFILNQTSECKVLFVGDPAQLPPVKNRCSPVFSAGFPTSTLTEVVRQNAGNPIIDLATMFRTSVHTGELFSFRPDNINVRHCERDEFKQLAIQEFQKAGWTSSDSKILAWTNKTVIAYNKYMSLQLEGSKELKEGDFAVCNQYISNDRCQLKTDQLVQITKISPYINQGVNGNIFEIDGKFHAFMPDSLEDKKAVLRKAKKEGDLNVVAHVNRYWIDLRAAYSCTINKAQGSTFNKVFIDLNDIKRCRDRNLLCRMLYVAVSRAREQVVFTGDLI